MTTIHHKKFKINARKGPANSQEKYSFLHTHKIKGKGGNHNSCYNRNLKDLKISEVEKVVENDKMYMIDYWVYLLCLVITTIVRQWSCQHSLSLWNCLQNSRSSPFVFRYKIIGQKVSSQALGLVIMQLDVITLHLWEINYGLKIAKKACAKYIKTGRKSTRSEDVIRIRKFHLTVNALSCKSSQLAENKCKKQKVEIKVECQKSN